MPFQATAIRSFDKSRSTLIKNNVILSRVHSTAASVARGRCHLGAFSFQFSKSKLLEFSTIQIFLPTSQTLVNVRVGEFKSPRALPPGNTGKTNFGTIGLRSYRSVRRPLEFVRCEVSPEVQANIRGRGASWIACATPISRSPVVEKGRAPVMEPAETKLKGCCSGRCRSILLHGALPGRIRARIDTSCSVT